MKTDKASVFKEILIIIIIKKISITYMYFETLHGEISCIVSNLWNTMLVF